MRLPAAASLGPVLATLLDLVLPTCCAGCGCPGGMLCPTCARCLAGPARPVTPWPTPAGFPDCRAVTAYDGPMRLALSAYKERGRRELAGPLAQALGRAVGSHPAVVAGAPVVLVPVPSRRAAVRRRGGDPTRRLAGATARALTRRGIEVRLAPAPALRLCRPTADSAGLSAPDRWVNLQGAMSAHPSRAAGGGVVVVVDDLLTTGATLTEASRALADAGCPGAMAAVVAATERWPGLGQGSGPR